MLSIDIKQELMKLNGQEVHEAFELLRRRQSIIAQEKANSFSTGQAVWFEGRGGRRVDGVVQKINQTTLSVKADSGVLWRVSAGLVILKQ